VNKAAYSMVVFLLVGIFLVPVAGAADLKIGFIDAERINRESLPAERATKKLEKEFAPREQDLRKLEQQIKALQGQLEKDGLTMSESDRRNKEQELGRQSREFQRLQREFREDLNLRRNEELSALFERANKVIKCTAVRVSILLIKSLRRCSRKSSLWREEHLESRKSALAYSLEKYWKCPKHSRSTRLSSTSVGNCVVTPA
jgi:outer membrane protein